MQQEPNKEKSCYGCPDRQVGCHSTCPYHAKREKKWEERRKAKQRIVDSTPEISKELRQEIYRRMKRGK